MFGSIKNLGPRQPSQYGREPFAHATAQQQRVGAQNVPTAIYGDVNPPSKTLLCFVPVRPGRSVLRRNKNGSNVEHMFFLFLKICFFRAAWNLFDVGNQSVPTHLAKQHSIRFVPVLLGGGLGHALSAGRHTNRNLRWNQRPCISLCLHSMPGIWF